MSWRIGDQVATLGRYGIVHHGTINRADINGQPVITHASKDAGFTREDYPYGFSGGQPIWLAGRAQPGSAPYVAMRARQRIGLPYDPVFNNCEQNASYIRAREASSPQLRNLHIIGGLVLWTLSASGDE